MALAPAVADEGSEIARPAARHSINMRQPWPAIFSPPMTQSMGMKTSVPQLGPFEGGAGGQMAAADVHTRMVGRDHGDRDADVLAAAQQVLWIEKTEGETHERRFRTERDVALIP